MDQYPDVKIEWIRHHNPELNVIDENGKTFKTIDLGPYDFKALHELFAKYFTKLGQGRMLGGSEGGGGAAGTTTINNSSGSSGSGSPITVTISSTDGVDDAARHPHPTPLRPNEAALPQTLGRQAADDAQRAPEDLLLRSIGAAAATWGGGGGGSLIAYHMLILAFSLVLVSLAVCVARRRRVGRHLQEMKAERAGEDASVCHVA